MFVLAKVLLAATAAAALAHPPAAATPSPTHSALAVPTGVLKQDLDNPDGGDSCDSNGNGHCGQDNDQPVPRKADSANGDGGDDHTAPDHSHTGYGNHKGNGRAHRIAV